MFAKLLLLIDPQPRTGVMNMSVDEALLRWSGEPILHVYEWSQPTASFGCLQPYREAVAHSGATRNYVRRWTGGGLVVHGDDWTYSVIVPPGARGIEAASTQWYRWVHELLAAELRNAGIATEVSSEGRTGIGAACFQHPVPYDIMRNGRKMAGAALRRSAAGLLLQGSVQTVSVPDDFGVKLAHCLAAEVEMLEELPQPVARAAKDLCREKYDTETWLRRR